MNTETDKLLTAAREAAERLDSIATRASCAPNDDEELAERELTRIMHDARGARDALRETLAELEAGTDSAHTAEPWHADDGMVDIAHQRETLPNDWRAVATGARPDDDDAVIALAHPDNARRIVAAVNAVAGIPTEELEGSHFAPADDEAPLYELVRDDA